jgi:AcrR family transcriptional regulator
VRKLDELAAARRLYRLCCGIEYALCVKGYRATVADVIEHAGMSRRTFYEIFESLHDAYIRMQRAMAREVERLHEAYAGEPNHVERWHRAYVHAQSCFPSADSMLSAMACDIVIDANRVMHLDVPLSTQSYIWCEQGKRPTPEAGPFDARLIQWARDMNGSGS